MDTHPKDPSTLTRRRTIAIAAAAAAAKPTSLNPPSPDSNSKPYHTTSLPNGAVFPPPPLDLSLPSYTSLKDLLPSGAASSLHSPTPSGAGGSVYEVPIRNRLVKQAACAYLQPMSSSPDYSPGLVRRLWLRLSSCWKPFSDAIRRIVRSLWVSVNPD